MTRIRNRIKIWKWTIGQVIIFLKIEIFNWKKKLGTTLLFFSFDKLGTEGVLRR